MKRIIVIALSGLILAGCTDKKAQNKAALDEVIKVHDKVMAADEQLMKNKMQLDTLISEKKLAATDSAVILNTKLQTAEAQMEDWMHKFEPDQTGKSDEETLKYLNAQKKQIVTVDSLINVSIRESTGYLKKVKAE